MQTTNPKIKMNMKKLVLGAAMLLLAQVGFGQAVNESAIIPVSVTLNAVSRLNVESGGNIKFVFTSINDYNAGFSGAQKDLYKTVVSVASSRDWGINMYSETANFLPTDNAANAHFGIDNLEYIIDWTGSAAAPGSINFPGNTDTEDWGQMSSSAIAVINTTVPADAGQGGDGTQNRFNILWRIGTGQNTSGTILEQSIAPDHYVANIFIELVN